MGATSFMIKGSMLFLLAFAALLILIAMICFAANDTKGAVMCVVVALMFGGISMYMMTRKHL